MTNYNAMAASADPLSEDIMSNIDIKAAKKAPVVGIIDSTKNIMPRKIGNITYQIVSHHSPTATETAKGVAQ